MLQYNKRIGIITILRVNNYGAELQAYATQRVMNLMGYDAEIIDYLYYRNVGHIRERCSLPFYPYPLKNRIKEWGLCLQDAIERLLKSNVSKSRAEKFENFHKTFNRMSAKQYKRYSELFNNPPVYDVYCVGSDQVWNPRCYTNLDAYFLTFAPKSAVKFSYASSFGVKEVPKSAELKYAECLKNLSFIGVREQDGVNLVAKLTGKSATWCADPTLLLDQLEWAKVELPLANIPPKYILVYELHSIGKIMETAQYLSEQLECPIVRICKNVSSKKDDDNIVNVLDAGPSEFIYLFNHALAIVTNSFHGTAFSINFRKDFYCILSRTASNNGRQQSLLSMCGLDDRIIYDDSPLPNVDTLKIDYSVASEIIESFKSRSIEYIKKVVDGK